VIVGLVFIASCGKMCCGCPFKTCGSPISLSLSRSLDLSLTLSLARSLAPSLCLSHARARSLSNTEKNRACLYDRECVYLVSMVWEVSHHAPPRLHIHAPHHPLPDTQATYIGKEGGFNHPRNTYLCHRTRYSNMADSMRAQAPEERRLMYT